MARIRQDLAYDIVSREIDGKYRSMVQFVCAACGTEHLIKAQAEHSNPEFIRNKFTAKGWLIDLMNRRRIRCPKCLSAKRDVEAQSPKMFIVPKEDTMAVASAATLPVLTHHQRTRIRDLLDKHFDDKVGAYLDSYSDQRIGQELSVPWLSVRGIREAAYGEIKRDPEVDALHRMMDDVKTSIRGAEETVAAARKTLELVSARIETIEKRVGIRA
jgi:DNA-directed RNA polymerase subunit RPC12/RpoP